MPTVHMIHGFLGSGKTTLARELEARSGGLRISIDEWTIGLSGDNVLLDQDLFASVWTLLADLWPECVRAGVDDVILDFGFWTRIQRDDARGRAARVGADVVLYAVLCSEEVARARCAGRNGDTPEYALDADAFDYLLQRFEPLDGDEPAVEVVTSW